MPMTDRLAFVLADSLVSCGFQALRLNLAHGGPQTPEEIESCTVAAILAASDRWEERRSTGQWTPLLPLGAGQISNGQMTYNVLPTHAGAICAALNKLEASL